MSRVHTSQPEGSIRRASAARAGVVFLCGSLLLAATACGGRAYDPGPGGGSGAGSNDGGGPMPDIGGGADLPPPPDLPGARDTGSRDLAPNDMPVTDRRQPMEDRAGAPPRIGEPCDPIDGPPCIDGLCEAPGADPRRGFCTVQGCLPGDPKSGGGDTCPAPARCFLDLEHLDSFGSSYCARRCDFASGGGCPEPLTCSPIGTCVPSCGSNMDCNGAQICDRATGVCIYPGGMQPVGGTCMNGIECQGAGSCLTPAFFPGGYCTVFGCERGGAFACPGPQDICTPVQVTADQFLSLCLRGCNLSNPDCRPDQTCQSFDGVNGVCFPSF